jgi:Domain of unknown function (DU1801)
MTKQAGYRPGYKKAEVAEVFKNYPDAIRPRLMALRQLIFDTAVATDGVGELEEALRWDEPAYLTSKSKSGSTIRIAWKESEPDQYAMYFNCQTNLVENFRVLFPTEFRFEGNRAIVFQADDNVALKALGECVAMALTYHLNRKSK